MVNKTHDMEEYRRKYHESNHERIAAQNREYRETNRDVILARQREYYSANRDKELTRMCAHSGYMNGELDPTSNVGRGFISEMIVAKTLGLESGVQCNCTANFHFFYDLLDIGGHGEINVKSAKIREDKRQGTWYWTFDLNNKYKPDTYIFVAYTDNYIDIEHVWIVSASADIISDIKGLGISNSEKGLSRVQEFEVDNTMYNVFLHTMSIDNCSVLKKQDFVEEMLECL